MPYALLLLLLLLNVKSFAIGIISTETEEPSPSEVTRATSYDDLTAPDRAAQGAEDCHELAPGESLKVYNRADESPTLLQRNYIVARDQKSPNIYNVTVPLKFFARLRELTAHQGSSAVRTLSPNDRDHGDHNPATAIAIESAAAQSEAGMIRFVESCFKKLDGKIRDSNGVEIRLRLAKKSDDIKPAKVNITPNDERSNSTEFARNAECSTVAHEAMHWLGLVDGYDGKDDDAGCRSVEPHGSLMESSFYALGQNREAFFCPPVNGAKAQIIKVESLKNIVDKCPGTFPKDGSFKTRELDSYDFKYYLNNPSQLGAPVYYRELPPQPFVLYPAHTRLITKPNCSSANKKYLACAQNAYEPIGKCKPVGEYCKNTDYLK